jgi:plastocyanin
MHVLAGWVVLVCMLAIGACAPASRPAASQDASTATPRQADVAPTASSTMTPVPANRVPTQAAAARATPNATPAVASSEVGILDDLYSPQVVTISVGEVVTWRNYGGKVHDAVSLTGEWSPSLLQPGSAARVTFNKPGKFEYTCSAHSSMTGWIVVQ